MEIYQAIILGAVQGITEFLPISSDGHLALFQTAFGLTQSIITYDILLHFATLIAIIIFFRRQIITLKKSTAFYIAIATIPAVIFGLLIEPMIELFYASLYIVSAGFFITSIFLISTKNISLTNVRSLNKKTSLLIGIAQAVAILPGVSRSGLTVSTALHKKIDRQEAFSFSFILAIPAILGATVLKLSQVKLFTIFNPSYLVGMTTAFVVGLISLKILQYVTNRAKLYYFGYYCLLLSAFTLILALS